MGFLKELFQKKMQDSEALEVQQRALSEYKLPALSRDAPLDERAAPVQADSLASDAGALFMRPEASAKSFSYVPVRKRQVEAAEAAAVARAAPAPPAPQARVKYESVSQFSQKVELYRGSISTVLKAVCSETGGKVIIKAYHKSKMHPKHFHKLQRELACMRTLKGPYVAELYSSFEDPGCVYLVMEYCEGGDLFKTMLMHGGVLEEQWVCVEVIAPLLRILEKMHAMKLLHRDIKPENIFLTGLGKFKLGDFGLAIKFDEEIPFSRSGTLDYMAPEVLKNPSLPFQEGRSVDAAMLAGRGVAAYGPPVDVWAAGVLAYELVTGHPPFEVEDEAQTAALIMYSNDVKFPATKTSQWADFVRAALVKDPNARPNAAQLLAHPWVQLNMQRVLVDNHRPSKDLLLKPLPLGPGGPAPAPAAPASALLPAPGGAPRFGQRNASFSGAAPSAPPPAPATAGAIAAAGQRHSVTGAAAGLLAERKPAAAGGSLSVAPPLAPQLPASFPASPTAVAALRKERTSAAAPALHLPAAAGVPGAEPLPHHAPAPAYGLQSPVAGAAAANRFAAERERAVLSARAASGDGAPLAPAGIAPPPSQSPPPPKRLSILSEAAHAGSPPPPPRASLGSLPCASPPPSARAASPSFGAAAATGSPLPPGGSKLRPSLRVALPPDAGHVDLEGRATAGAGADGVCYSPSTPAVKSGMKERMKFYFQRQAGSAGGL